MKRFLESVLGVLAVIGAVSSTAAVQAAPSVTIEVSAPDRGYTDCPLTVEVAAPASAKSVVLTEAKSGKRVPCQLSRKGGKAFLTLILPDLKRGSSATYKAEFSDRPTPIDNGVRIRRGEEAADISIGGTLFTKYVFSGAEKPYLYPVYGPYGNGLTRNYPMKKGVANERADHPHQRSLWFTHGEVNGTSYWSVGGKSGLEKQRGFDVLESGPVMGWIEATIDWVKPNGKKDCESVRDIRFYNVRNGRMFDWTETVKATEGPVVFGDTKEGTFGIRVAGTMKVDAKMGGKIVNANGQTDKAAWGRRAAWCDYSGPVGGKTVGIAIFDHPASFRHPTYWHVRTYGLFAANPFGLHNFVREWAKERRGEYTMQKGDSITFRYRVYIHKGNAEEAKVAGFYDQYANPPKVTVR